jgi:hypothetical protein
VIADAFIRVGGLLLCGVMYVVIFVVCGREQDPNLEVYAPGQPR